MLRVINQIDWTKATPAVFITLTYPDEYGDRTKEQRNQDRHVFFRAMEKHLNKKVGALWRIEWKARKSGVLLGTIQPHVHMLVFGVRFIPHQEVRKWWRCALTARGHLATDIRRIRSGKKAVVYVSKYCAKAPPISSLDIAPYLNTTGRHWGLHRKVLLPYAEKVIIENPDEVEINWLENLAANKLRDFERGKRIGFSLFGDEVKDVAANIIARHVDKQRKAG